MAAAAAVSLGGGEAFEPASEADDCRCGARAAATRSARGGNFLTWVEQGAMEWR